MVTHEFAFYMLKSYNHQYLLSSPECETSEKVLFIGEGKVERVSVRDKHLPYNHSSVSVRPMRGGRFPTLPSHTEKWFMIYLSEISISSPI